jgi:adenylate cyclase
MIEIERKFLVSSTEFFALADSKVYIKQGYLSKDPHRTVRVRIKDERAFLTIKGISSESGMSRFEWEKEIALEEGETLMRLCLPNIIEKTRFIVPQGTLTFEVDVFEREHKGLILAEIELPSEKTTINLPPWIGKEVTGDKRYYNSYLSSKESKNSL